MGWGELSFVAPEAGEMKGKQNHTEEGLDQ